jgi:hypothetical protein
MRLTLVIVFIAASAYGQTSIDLFTIAGFVGFPSSYQPPLNGKATESNLFINAKAPIVLNDKTVWFNDLTYSAFTITTDLTPEPATYLTSMRLHGFILQTGISRKLSDKNGLQLLFLPRYNSDFNGSDAKNWQFGGIALFEHRYSEKLMMRFGTMFNNELFGPLLVPLVYVDWRMSDRWSMVGLFPINLKINYAVSERVSVGLSHFGFITTYRISQPGFETDYIERNSIDEALFARWRVAGNLHLETRVGYSLARVYEQYAESEKLDLRLSIVRFGDDRTKKNVAFNNGPMASIRLVYNLPID